jgi:hypothetical protein
MEIEVIVQNTVQTCVFVVQSKTWHLTEWIGPQIMTSVPLSLAFEMWNHGVLPTEWLWTLSVFWNYVT